jgi:octaprenyl-diphosphate synthase
LTTALTRAEFPPPIERNLEQVRTALREVSRDFRESIRELLQHAAPDRGKLLRPALLLLSGGLCGTITPEHVRAATILELIHNVTLLHDDVLDRGGLRRGRPTVNRCWGNLTAVQLGDALLSRVLELSTYLSPAVRAVLGRMIRRTCEGEIRQTVHAGDFVLTERKYLAIVAWKTAALFEGACYLGACLAHASRAEARAVARFGYSTGLAYQITDDLLDIAGDDRVLRKTLGTDLRSAKLTLPVIHALRVLDEPQRGCLLQALRDRRLSRSELSDVLNASGSMEYVRVRIGAYAQRAVQALRPFQTTPVKAALLDMPGSIAQAAAPSRNSPAPAVRGPRAPGPNVTCTVEEWQPEERRA